MASIWQNMFSRGTASESPTISKFLHLSNTNIQRISYLTSHDQSHTEETLNLSQCQSLSSKLVRVLENIAGLFYFRDQDSTSATLPIAALENFYLVSERAKELVESCSCSDDWCKASTFQVQNEEAFKDILLETSLCYNTIYDLVKHKVPYQDLRQTSTFEPPTSAEVVQDRMALVQRYQKFVENSYNSDALIRKQHLAMYLLRKLTYVASQSGIDDFDMTTENLWPHGRNSGDEWGKNSVFLGRSVYKTTWLDVPCAKKVFFEDGVREEEILLEARILACLNHPNIVKFICWGHETEKAWRHFIAMEQMDRSLHSLIKKQAEKEPPFPLLSAMDIMLQIAYGMCYLHDNGVAHRDLKTGNVVVCQITTPHLQDYVHVKLIDFGLSKVKLSASRSNTISRPKIGTTVYMAPEAFQRGRANWFKVDVYSFGIMCSVILSGKEPFSSGERRSEIYEKICKGERPMLPTDTPEDLACLIKDCWAKDQKIRPNFLDICIRLAKLRHKLLRDDPHETDVFASLYIQNMIKKRSDAQKQDCKQLLKTVTEEDEWFDPDQEFGIQKEHEPTTTASYGNESSSYVEIPKQLRNSTSGSLVDDRRKSDISWSFDQTMPSSTQSRIQAGEPEEPTSPGGSSPLSVQPGDLIGLKRQLVQLLNQNGGKMMLTNVPAEYNKLFGRPLHLAEYNAQRLVHLINKMKDTLVIKGYGTPKTLHLIKKEQGRVTNKYKPSSNRASAPKGDKDKDTSEDSEPEETVPPKKEHEKENNVDASKVKTVIVEEVEESVGDFHRANLANFKRQLQEPLVVHSYQIPYNKFIRAYQQRFSRILDLPSFGVVSMEAHTTIISELTLCIFYKIYQEFGIQKKHEPKTTGNESSSYVEIPKLLRNSTSGSLVDDRSKSDISWSLDKFFQETMPSSTQSRMQAGESKEPSSRGGSSPLRVQPGDLIGLKRQLVQLLNQNGGEMMLSNVPAEYNKLFGRPFNQAEYNGQRLGNLIDKMKDTLVINGERSSKTLHLIKKEQGRVTNKYKPSSNRASAPKGDKDKDTSEDSEPEDTVPPKKEQRNSTSGSFVDDRSKSNISWSLERTQTMPSSTQSRMQAGESKEPSSRGGSSPLRVQPGDLIGLKRQLVQLLNQNGGEMMLSNVPAEYNTLFGRPFNQAEYNGQRLGNLIDKMKDTLVINGERSSKTLHLIKKEQGRVTKPSSNRASAPKGHKDK